MYRQAFFQTSAFFFQSVYFIPKASFGGLGEKKINTLYSTPTNKTGICMTRKDLFLLQLTAINSDNVLDVA